MLKIDNKDFCLIIKFIKKYIYNLRKLKFI
jgi:hypothetical protein